MYADYIDFNQKQEEMHGSGSVEIITSSASAYAPDAVFLHKENRLTFTGTPQPKLVFSQDKQKGTYTADKITIYMDTKKTHMEGSVHGLMTLKERPKAN
jgi:lipopolysaccharide export system protein LptA